MSSAVPRYVVEVRDARSGDVLFNVEFEGGESPVMCVPLGTAAVSSDTGGSASE